MTAIRETTWLDANQRRLTAELARVRGYLAAHLGVEEASRNATPDSESFIGAIDTLTQRFGLSPFERDVLLLAAGFELESSFSELLAGGGHVPPVSFGLALAVLPGAHWSALAPDAPLRHFDLLHVFDGDRLTSRRIVIDERVLHYLAGIVTADTRLTPLLRPLSPEPVQTPTQSEASGAIVAAWRAATQRLPVIQLIGNDADGARAVAARAANELGLRCHLLRAEDLIGSVQERDLLQRLLTRECLLSPCVFVFEAPADPLLPFFGSFVADLACPIVVVSEQPVAGVRGPVIEVPRPTPREQCDLWTVQLGEAHLTDPDIERLSHQFSLSAEQIGAIARDVRTRSDESSISFETIARACRLHCRGGLDDLAQRIDSASDWDDLTLPPAQIQLLKQLAAQVRHRSTVHEGWGFGAKGTRGLGISALFVGESGTGKSLAAEVITNELDLDLYRIDLSSVVSKYIGETEKNLKRVFDAAQASGAVLLFDEADALFGKRSDVKDSHDRYANIEVGYLLQRIETYSGLAILTSNLKGLLDTAFLRRFRFVVNFPFPDARLRGDIWRQVLPDALPLNDLSFERLARLSVAGGSIRNIAINAAFLSAADGGAVTMAHLLRASQVEFAKLERNLTETEIGGWV